MPARARILLMADATVGYDRRVLGGVGQYAESATDWLFRTYGSSGEDLLCERLIRTWHPAGVVSLARTWSGPLRLAHSMGIPIVQAVETDEDVGRLPVPCVYTDGRSIAATAADYFAGLGLASVGYVGEDRGSDRLHADLLRAEAGRRDLAFDAFLGETRGEVDPHGLQLQRWLAGLPPRTGLLAASDWHGWHVTSEAVDAGFNVPDHFAVLGIGDDRPWSELAPVPLSSVCLAAEKVGYRAAGLLDHLIRRRRPVAPDVVRIPPSGLVARRSTDVLATDDPDIAAALRYIHDHAGRGCSVKEVLAEVAIDRRRLERWCRAKLGRSPRAEVQRLRVDAVKRMLAETDERVEQVAHLTGFGSASVLCRTFKRQTGTTVARYRRQYRRASDDPRTVPTPTGPAVSQTDEF